MKRVVKFISCFLILLSFNIQFVQADTTEDLLTVDFVTEKDSYSSSEEVEVNVILKNNSTNFMKNVKVTSEIPNDLEFVYGNGSFNIDNIDYNDWEKGSFKVKLKSNNKEEIDYNKQDNILNDDFDKNNNYKKDELTQKNTQVKTSSSKTSDSNNLKLLIIICSISLIILSILIFNNKRKQHVKKYISIILLITISSVLLSNIVAKASEDEEVLKNSATAEKILYIGKKEYKVVVNIEYEIKAKESVEEPELEKLIEVVNKKQGNVDINLENESKNNLVTSAKVDYTLKNGTGFVSINDSSEYSYVSKTIGAVGNSIDINVINDEVNSAIISFNYDEAKLGDIKEEDLAICWYNEKENKMVLLENSVVDAQNNIVSVETNHFSEYVLIDSSKWKETWAKEQLIIRNDNDEEAKYFNILFVIDASGSMYGSNNLLSKEATLAFIKQLNDLDMISVIAFNHNTRYVIEKKYKKDMTEEDISNNINSIIASGGTSFDNALNKACDAISEMTGQRLLDNSKGENVGKAENIIVFLSDGEDSVEAETLEKMNELYNKNCKTVVIGLGEYVNESALEQIALKSNGQYINAKSASDLKDIFEQINGQYVGLTVDTDGDGIPDIIERTGMRDNYGEVHITNPESYDTDGDGLSDGEEMGTFIEMEDGKSYFEINSDPSIPTNISDEARIEISSLEINNKVDTAKLKEKSFKELNSMFNSYNAKINVKSVKRYIQKDYLSETVYKGNISLIFKVTSEDCTENSYVKNINLYSGSSEYLTFDFKCKNGIDKCKHKTHKVTLEILQNGNKLKSFTKEINLKDNWKETIENKIALMNSNVARDLILEKGKNCIDEMQKEYKNNKKKVEDFGDDLQIVTNIEDNDVVKKVEEIYKDEYKEFINKETDSFTNVNTNADLVNGVYKKIAKDKNKKTFEVNNKKYTFYIELDMPVENAVEWQVGHLKSEGKKYFISIIMKNEENIQKYLNDMKDFADMKIEEAKEEVFSAASEELELKALKKWLTDTLKIKSFTLWETNAQKALGNHGEYKKKLEKIAKRISDLAKLKKMFDDISDINLDDCNPEDIVSKIDDYNSSLLDIINDISEL